MFRIRLGGPQQALSLLEFLAGVAVEAERTTDPDLLSASLPGAPSAAHERRELAAYVQTWLGLNPGFEAEIAPAAVPGTASSVRS